MSDSTRKTLSTSELFEHVARLAKEYFMRSDDGYWAILTLLGLIVGIIASVALTVLFSSYVSVFFTALSATNVPLFIESIKMLAVTITAMGGLKAFNNYLSDMLAANWRHWLTNRLTNQFSENYLNLNRDHADNIANVDVTIEKSVKDFVELTFYMGTDLLRKTLTLPVYMRNLWVIGGAMTFAVLGISITIPGYLVFGAILFAITSSLLTHAIGSSLKDLVNNKTNLEADLREEVDFVNNNSESIALGNTMDFHKKLIAEKSDAIYRNSSKIAFVNTGVNTFNEVYQTIAWIIPYIAAAPLYFAHTITEGELNSIGFAFGQVQGSLSWFIDSYGLISRYAASVERIVELEKAMSHERPTKTTILIQKNEDNKNLIVNDLSIAKDSSSTDYMMRHLRLTLEPNKPVCIQGASGTGKSTFFKAMGGTWNHGNGTVLIPEGHTLSVLPQAPVIPLHSTLKAVLSYPVLPETHTQKHYERVLRETDMAKFIEDLDKDKNWSETLSGGEKQKIAVARVLLKKVKPNWIFLDEATSALDEPSEALMYSLLRNLDGTTINSIAHRASVKQFHTKVVNLDVDEERVVHPKYS